MPTLAWWSGFDIGRAPSTTANTGRKYIDTANSPTVSSSNPRTGAYSLQMTGTTVVRDIELSSATLGTVTSIVASFYLMFPSSLPVGSPDVLVISTTGSQLFLFYQASGTRLGAAWNGGGTVNGPVVVADTWYQIDVKVDASANPNTMVWQVNGVAQTGTTTAVTAGNATAIAFGRDSAATGTYSYDDCRVSVTAADYPLGPGKVILLKPDTAGTAAEIGTANGTTTFTGNATVGTTFDSALLLSRTSEVPPAISASADGFAQRTSGTTIAVEIPMTSYTLGGGETIEAVVIRVLGWSASALANTLELRAFDGNAETTVIAREDPNFDNSTATPAWWCATYTPSGGWSQAKLDALTIRIGYSNDVSPVPGAHGIYAEVSIQQAPAAPSAVAAVTSVPAVTVSTGSGSASISATAVATTASVPSATPSTGSTITAVTVATTAAVGAVTFTSAATPAPSAVAAIASVGTVTPSTGSTVSPAAVAAVAAVPAPTLSAGSTIAAASAAGVASVPAVTVSVAGNVTISASPVVGAASAPAPTVTTGSTVTASTVAGAAAVGSPTVTTGSTAAPTSVAATGSVPTATPSTGTTLTLTTVAGVAAIASPAVTIGTQAAPATVGAVASIGVPAPSAGSTASPGSVAAVAGVGAVTVTTRSRITYRPYAGTTGRPATGTTTRPFTGTTTRP